MTITPTNPGGEWNHDFRPGVSPEGDPVSSEM
jgi:hypothetical protein